MVEIDIKHPLDLAEMLYKIMDANPNLVPHAKIPQSIQLFMSEANFKLVWDTGLALMLQEQMNYDLCRIDVHCLYESFIVVILFEFKHNEFRHLQNPA
ncbi:hypothetical protein C8J57DRAFT_1497673 [Mycena rebaudengoi]|nr:hypothetical protein C8J57DRAFT_1497673 [Mycena rebaudengoi]